MIINIILTILVFSLLIIVHELGHFFAAKWSGVKVNEFWLGMGPTIVKKHYKGTDYMINALPFGGAVVMEGEDDESNHKNSFQNAKKLNKAIIMFAGAFMNFVLGFIIVFLIFLPTKTTTTTDIDSFRAGYDINNQSELLPGDTIMKIDGYEIKSANQISSALNLNDSYIFDFTVLRNDEEVEISQLEIKPTIENNGDLEQKIFGINLDTKTLNLLDKLELTVKQCLSYGEMVWLSLVELFSGNVSVNEMSGPIGISKMIGETAKISMSSMWGFVAFISINLGIMNLLPLPALDGGRLLFLGIETITRKPINKKVEGIIHGIGLVILFGLMIFITFHDIFVKIL